MSLAVADYLAPIQAGAPIRGSMSHDLGVGSLFNFNQDLKAWKDGSDGAKWLYNLMCEQDNGRPVHPQTAVEVLSCFGVTGNTTLLEIDALAKSLPIAPERWERLFSPKLELPWDDLPIIENFEWIQLAEDTLVTVPDMEIGTYDLYVKCVSRKQLTQICESRFTSGMFWKPQREDCDDFAFAAKGALSRLGYGAILGVLSIINVKPNGDSASLHAINFCVVVEDDGSRTIQLIEPNGMRLVDSHYAIDGGVSNKVISMII